MAAVLLATLAFLLLFAAFPWGLVAPWAVRHAAGQLGLSATVGRAVRLDRFSFSPTVALEEVGVRQPHGFSGGEMVQVRHLTLRFAAWPLLAGRFEPLGIDLAGARVHLLRLANGRANWQGGVDAGGARGVPRIARLRVADARIRIDDALRQLALTAAIDADARGLRVVGAGTLAGDAVRLEATGGAIDALDPGRPYPLHLRIASRRVTLNAVGTTDKPCDAAHWRAHVRASGDDLADLDRIIRAGLPATQAFALAADVRHDGARWRIDPIAGRIGRSRMSGRIAIERRDGRTTLDGDVHAATLDFNDLASDADLARGTARERQLGRRVLPHLRIDLSHLAHTDGRVRLIADRLLSDRPSVFRSLSATLALDHRLLTVRLLAAGLMHGTLTGSAVVDHRGRTPRLSLDLALHDARIEDLFTSAQDATAPLGARVRLTGRGSYLSDALARADGSIGLASTGGSMRKLIATLAAGDVLKGLGEAVGNSRDRTPIRCIAGRFRSVGGQVTPTSLVIDTAVMQGRGTGTVDLGTERIALDIATRSKHPDLIQSAVPIRIRGTLAEAHLDVTPPAATRGRHGLFGKVGAFLGTLRTRGDAGRGEAAGDANCPALVAAALR